MKPQASQSETLPADGFDTLPLQDHSSPAATPAASPEAALPIAQQARVLEQFADAVVAIDGAGAISYWGPQAERFFGARAADAVGRPLLDLLLPEGLSAEGDLEARAVLAAGGVWRSELLLRAGAARLPCELSVRVVAGAGDCLVLVRDLSARRRADDAHGLLVGLLGAAPIGIDLIDRDLRFVLINEALAASNGLPVADHLGRTVREVLPHMADVVEPLLRRVLETGEPILDVEVEGEAPNEPGARRLWRESLFPVRGADGRPVAVGAIVADITEHRRGSAERARLLAAIASSAERTAGLQSIAAALAPALTPAEVARVTVEESVRALHARSGALLLLQPGRAALELSYAVGYADDTFADLQFDLDADLPACEAVRRGAPIYVHDLGEAEARYPELAAFRAQVPDVAWATLPLISEGRKQGALSLGFTTPQEFSAEDRALLTAMAQQCAQALERARLYAAERQLREAAEGAVRERDDLIALISHDLKNPLTVIQGQAQLMERRLSRGETIEPARLVRGLSAIYQAAGHISAQIEELLDLAVINAGRPLRLDVHAADLATIVRRAVSLAQTNTERHSLLLEVEDDDLAGEWDGRRVERVVGNLLSNAIKYSPAGGKVRVQLRREHDVAGDWAQLSVADQGIGIPSADLPHIFERFHRAANTVGRIRGTGLGLTSALRVVEQQGGTLEVVSVEGEGSTFTMRLPLAAGSP